MVNRIRLYDLSRMAMISLLAEWGYSEFHANLLWGYLYGKHVISPEGMTDLRPDLVGRLRAKTDLATMSLMAAINSKDGHTTKFLLSGHDDQSVETVLMRYDNRNTVCVSTQVGCAMGCVFCATGQMGYIRHLSAGEIVEQVLFVTRQLASKGLSLRNIVFMGMGEPLHNYDSTMAAIDIITDDKGLAIGPRHITLSTIGIPAAIRRMADEGRKINLAVSLHAATDIERNKLVPVNRRWSLEELLDSCSYYSNKRDRRIFFEWALIGGENDTPAQAHSVGKVLSGLRAHVNLIPLNPTEGYDGSPSSLDAAHRFQNILTEYQLPSTIRQRRGIDIDAGCGQLRQRVEKLGD